MLRCAFNLLRRPALGRSALLHRGGGDGRTRNAQFISFLDESGFRRVNPDRYERSLRRRRVAAYVLMWAMVSGFAWVVIESAQALSIF
jgi:hypothetical protein